MKVACAWPAMRAVSYGTQELNPLTQREKICCIDKTSTAELSEAINSMFRWYTKAEVCYAHLVDIADDALEVSAS